MAEPRSRDPMLPSDWCRYEPRQEAVQRCSPTVKEVCSTQLETRCEAECGESCEVSPAVIVLVPQKVPSEGS